MTPLHCFYRFTSEDATVKVDVWDSCDALGAIPSSIEHPETGEPLRLTARSRPMPQHLPDVGELVFVPMSEVRAAQNIRDQLEEIRSRDHAEYDRIREEMAVMGESFEAYLEACACALLADNIRELQPATVCGCTLQRTM